MTYLPFIDGLRAVAILAVVAYHAFPRALPGGFAGVDVFFVVSGFLITRFIYHEINERHFSFPSFLVRRARRLLPAAVVCLTLTLAIGYFVLPPAGFQDLGRSLVATVLMYANFFFYRLAGYFSPQASELPLLHTWSLAVEDQFYLTWPLILMLLAPRLPRRYLLTAVVGVMALSLAIAVRMAIVNPEWAFFMLPSRAWELLLGCTLALVLAARTPEWSRTLAELAALVGVAAIFSSFLLLDASSTMPGLDAVPVCLGVAIVIASSLQHRTKVERAFSGRLPVFIGRISYSLYLFHWPLLALATHQLDRTLTTAEALAIVAASLGLAVVSWKYVEQPFRAHSGRAWGSNRQFIVAGASAAAALVLVGNAIHKQGGWPWRYDGHIGELLSEMSSRNPRRERCDEHDRIFVDDAFCNVGRPKLASNSYDAALIGDSTADQWAPLLEIAARQNGWAARQVTHGGCAFFPGVDLPVKDIKTQQCTQYQQQSLRFIEANPGLKLVIVSARWQDWQPRLDRDLNAPAAARGSAAAAISAYHGLGFEDAVLRMVKVFRERGIKVHILGPVPALDFQTRCIIKSARVNSNFDACGISAERARASLQSIEEALRRVAAGDAGVSYSLPREFICSSGVCRPVIDGVLVYRKDAFHLNDNGARLLAKFIQLPSLD